MGNSSSERSLRLPAHVRRRQEEAATCLADAVERAGGGDLARAGQNLLRQQKPDGHWVGELMVDSTLCSDYVLFMHWLGEVDETLQRRCVRHILKRQLPDGGWNIYYGGPSEINACVKAYFALKLAGPQPRSALHAGSARQHPAPRRHPADEHLQQALPRVARAIPLEISADHSGGDDPAAELVLLQHLQDVVLEPGHAHPARDHQSFQADPRAAARQATARALSGRHRGKRFHPAAGPAPPDLAQFFPARRPRSSNSSSALHSRRLAPARAGGSRTLDGRTHRRGERRPGRDLPGDAQFDDRAARPRLSEDASALPKGARGFRRVSSSTTRRISAFSPVFRRSGTPRSISSRWPSPASRRSIPRCKRRRSGWSTRKCASAAIGR